MRPIRPVSAFIATLMFALFFTAPGNTQRGQSPGLVPTPNGPMPANSDPKDKGDTDPTIKSIEQRQARARNDDRQKRLVSDTDKLLALATQLHEDVGKTDKNILSLDVVKRAEEIEKLARSVKERMRG